LLSIIVLELPELREFHHKTAVRVKYFIVVKVIVEIVYLQVKGKVKLRKW